MRKKYLAICCVIILLSISVSSCASLPKTPPPPGCEAAMVYKVPGFVPFGTGTIRLAALAVCTAAPMTKPFVVTTVAFAYKNLQEQRPRSFIIHFITIFEPWTSYFPRVNNILCKAKDYFTDDKLTECDRNVLASLAQNIYRDLTGNDIWESKEVRDGASGSELPSLSARVGLPLPG